MRTDRRLVVVVGVVVALCVVVAGVLVARHSEANTREQVSLILLKDCLARATTTADLQVCDTQYRHRR